MRYARYSIFHINVDQATGSRRTTISIEPIIADLLAVKLGKQPGSKEAHTAVREWIQGKQDEQHSSKGQPWLIKNAMIMEITDKQLFDTYWKYRLESEDIKISDKKKKKGTIKG